MIKVHNVSTNILTRDGCHQEVEEEENKRIENHLGVVQEWQGAVAQKADVTIIDHGYHEQRIAGQTGEEVIRVDQNCKQNNNFKLNYNPTRILTVVEKELEDMENEQGREEGIEVNIERIAPLHIFVGGVLALEVTIGDHPEQ